MMTMTMMMTILVIHLTMMTMVKLHYFGTKVSYKIFKINFVFFI